MRHASLIPHPATSGGRVVSLDVRVSVQPGGELTLTYTLSGEIAGLVIPEPATPGRADGLWRHTCFEAFVMTANGPAYREFNFSPSGEWAAYRFSSYRVGGPLEQVQAPAICCRACDCALELEAHLPGLARPDGIRLLLGLSAVLEHTDGTLSYWALRHPPGKPDFHHTDGFILSLDQP